MPMPERKLVNQHRSQCIAASRGQGTAGTRTTTRARAAALRRGGGATLRAARRGRRTRSGGGATGKTGAETKETGAGIHKIAEKATIRSIVLSEDG